MDGRMSLKEAVASVFRKYAEFQGRARRSEFWYFALFNFLVYSLSSVIYYLIMALGASGGTYGSLAAAFSGGSALMILYGIYSLVIILPGLAVACRRLHDIGRSGAYLLFAFIPAVGFIFLLIWFLQEGDPGANRYGADPKAGGAVYIPSPVRAAPDRSESRPKAVRYEGTMPASEAYTEPYTASYTAPSSLYLKGATGYYSGRRIPLHGTLVAGRDPGCAIAFPGETRGVSHRHCQFRVQGGLVVVTDLGSSYGTFINGRNKLKPHASVTLSPGDSVGLGSEKQCLILMEK